MEHTLERAMPKRLGRPVSDRNDGSAKVNKVVLSRAQVVAKDRGITLAEYLSETLRGPVDRDYLELVKRLEPGAESPSNG